jgi:hypothetical protein
MRDKSHAQEIERWAEYVRDNPDKWKAKLKLFLDAQILMARRFYKKLLGEEGGEEKLRELRRTGKWL